MSHCSLVYMLAGVAQFLYCPDDDPLELITPNGVELIDFLVLLDGELGQGCNKALGCLGILLRLETVVFYLLLSILFRFVTM